MKVGGFTRAVSGELFRGRPHKSGYVTLPGDLSGIVRDVYYRSAVGAVRPLSPVKMKRGIHALLLLTVIL